MLSSVVIVGHSHTVAVRNALTARNRHWAAPDWLEARVVDLRTLMPSLGLTMGDVTTLPEDGPPRLHPEVLAEIERQIVPGSRVYIVSMIGGNVHNILGLMRANVPFDFVLPEAPALQLEPGAQVIPYAALTACLEQRLRWDRAALEALRHRFPGVLLHLESPPPARDDEFVLKTLDVFRTLNASGEIVSPALRYKLWRLHSTVVRRFCHDLGIIYVESPIEARDPQGFLARQAYADATHANSWFGSRQLGQIEAFVMVDQSESAA